MSKELVRKLKYRAELTLNLGDQQAMEEAAALIESQQRAIEGMDALDEAWRLHEVLCDIWGDNAGYDEMMAEFRAFLKAEGFANRETLTPEFAGQYVQAMVIYALRDFMTARARATSGKEG